jgi:hypothetical protein
LLLPGRTLVDYAQDLPRVIHHVAWRTPDAADTEFTAAALRIVEGAIHLAPRVTTAEYHAPSMQLGVPDASSMSFFGCLVRRPMEDLPLTEE